MVVHDVSSIIKPKNFVLEMLVMCLLDLTYINFLAIFSPNL